MCTKNQHHVPQTYIWGFQMYDDDTQCWFVVCMSKPPLLKTGQRQCKFELVKFSNDCSFPILNIECKQSHSNLEE